MNPTQVAPQVPAQFKGEDGKVNVLSVGFFALTALALVYGIWNSRMQIKKLREENDKMKELEHNLKEIMGDKYQKI